MNEKSPIPLSTNASVPTIANEVLRNLSYINRIHNLNSDFRDILDKFLSQQGEEQPRPKYPWDEIPVKERLMVCNNELEIAVSELEQLLYKLRTETIG